MSETRPSEVMARLGIVQADAPILHRACEPVSLPRDAHLLSTTIAALAGTLDVLATVHDFAKGMGLAAPQINLPHAVAIVRPHGIEQDQIVLVNPRVLDASEQTHETYEGCMSFFDVRGLVPRPRTITVEHLDPDTAAPVTTTFHDARARLIAHEIDHLHGRLYTDHLRPGVTPIPVEQYRLTGRPWELLTSPALAGQRTMRRGGTGWSAARAAWTTAAVSPRPAAGSPSQIAISSVPHRLELVGDDDRGVALTWR